jgi:response regulator of citrate/malate metabolism
MQKGFDELVRDKTRPPGKPPLLKRARQKMLAETASEMPPSATPWSVGTMAKAMGISRTTVQRI